MSTKTDVLVVTEVYKTSNRWLYTHSLSKAATLLYYNSCSVQIKPFDTVWLKSESSIILYITEKQVNSETVIGIVHFQI